LAPDALRLVATSSSPGTIAPEGARVDNPALAELLEALAHEGPDLFYRGELAATIARDCVGRGGLLRRDDLASYRVIERKPLELAVFGTRGAFNPPPTPGGGLLAFALALLDEGGIAGEKWGSPAHCSAVVNAMAAAGRVRAEPDFDEDLAARFLRLLAPEELQEWRLGLRADNGFSRGTTHISVADARGNLASLTVSNGEGSAYVVPGTGIMLNNMLGEQDLNPDGFHRWPRNSRLASMMCPTIARLADGGCIALGSGGSNRIRSAVLQVLVNVLVFGQSPENAVDAPRLHLEGERLSIEAGFTEPSLDALKSAWPDHQAWPDRSIFFGGVHAVTRHKDGRLEGAGDPRRGGAVVMA
jgi:gamma-glutamyltranspeptidase/glutathione hydrolase